MYFNQMNDLQPTLPRDLVLKTVSYMDIDTRRSLGIFSKLRIPREIKDALEAVLPHPRRLLFNSYSRVSLGPFRTHGFMYVLHSDFGMMSVGPVSCGHLGHNWYHPCFLDKSSPLIMSYIQHQDDDCTISYIMESNQFARDPLSHDVYLKRISN